MFGKINTLDTPAVFTNFYYKLKATLPTATCSNDTDQQTSPTTPEAAVPSVSSPSKRKLSLTLDDIKMASNAAKLKSIWFSIFQAQNNSFMVQKSIKQQQLKKSAKDDSSSANDDTTSNCSSAGDSTSNSGNDYRKRREKNNEAVRKSRMKSRNKVLECQQQVEMLLTEKHRLNHKLVNMQGELSTLKNLLQQCFAFNQSTLPVNPVDIPTSTLYKIIMNKHAAIEPAPAAPQPSTSSASAASADYTEEDMFYMNTLLNVLSNSKITTQPQQQQHLTPPATPPLSAMASLNFINNNSPVMSSSSSVAKLN